MPQIPQNPMPATSYQPIDQPPQQAKKPWYKKWWIWAIVAVIVIGGIGSLGGGGKDKTPEAKPVAVVEEEPQSLGDAPDQVGALLNEARANLELEGFKVDAVSDNGKTIIVEGNWTVTKQKQNGDTVLLTVTDLAAQEEAAKNAEEDAKLAEAQAAQKAIDDAAAAELAALGPECQTAIRKGQQYSDLMAISKAGLYEQLTSEYGEQYTPEAGQCAVDYLDKSIDWNANALRKAETYRDEMAMSPAAIYDQLVSEYGEKFTPEQAQYAVDNLG